MYQYFVTEQEKIRADEIKSKVYREPVSLDDLRLLIKSLKHDIELKEIRLIELDKTIARDKFDLLNDNDHSFLGLVSKGLLALSTGAGHMSMGAIKYNISTIRNLITKYETILHEWESDPEAKKRHDDKLVEIKNILKEQGYYIK